MDAVDLHTVKTYIYAFTVSLLKKEMLYFLGSRKLFKNHNVQIALNGPQNICTSS